jgi:hypothetical protein
MLQLRNKMEKVETDNAVLATKNKNSTLLIN